MRLQILCDLHLEFADIKLPDVSSDVVILAGDIHVGRKGVHWAKKMFNENPVVYVIGNHEYYYNDFPGLIEVLKEDVKGSNIHILENESIRIGNYRIYGCTLWSDMELFGDSHAAVKAASEKMNDYRVVRQSISYRKLTPKDTRKWHFHSVQKLTEFLSMDYPEKNIIVTHHAPSLESIVDRFRSHPVTPAFASNMNDFIVMHQPILWIHGHTHESFDYQIGNTRIVCNPRGYAPEDNPEFKPDFTLVL